jgi:hypothetical protein
MPKYRCEDDGQTFPQLPPGGRCPKHGTLVVEVSDASRNAARAGQASRKKKDPSSPEGPVEG